MTTELDSRLCGNDMGVTVGAAFSRDRSGNL